MIYAFAIVHTFAGDFDSMFQLVATIIMCLIMLFLSIMIVIFSFNLPGDDRGERKKQKQNKKAS